MVYSRKINDKEMTFGISGRLYKSNVLLYDHQTDSLWSQLMSQAIAGPHAGRDLQPLPSARMTWKKWRQLHPHTQVLSIETGFDRNYAIDPYEGYYRVGGLMFPVGRVRSDLPVKDRVMGISIGEHAKAYSLEELKRRPGRLDDRIAQTPISIEISNEGEVVAVRDASGREIAHMFVYWFAWQAFHPQTEVFSF